VQSVMGDPRTRPVVVRPGFDNARRLRTLITELEARCLCAFNAAAN